MMYAEEKLVERYQSGEESICLRRDRYLVVSEMNTINTANQKAPPTHCFLSSPKIRGSGTTMFVGYLPVQ